MTDTLSRSDLGSTRTKIFYGFGSAAYGIKDFAFSQLLLVFYNQIVGLPAPVVGTGIFMALVFDAFADPIVGQISDNLRTPLGRRHPLMYASAIPVAVSLYLLFHPPHWSHSALFAYLVVMAIIVRTFITFYEIPSSALVPEMTDNYDERTSFLSYRYFFGLAGQVLISFVTFFVLLRPDAAHHIGQLNPAGYAKFSIVAPVLIVVSILISTRGTQRLVPLLRVPPVRRITVLQTLKEMAATLSHRSFLLLVVCSLCGATAIGLSAVLLVYFNTYFWGLSAAQISSFGFTGLVAVVLPPLLAPPLSKRMGKRNACLVFFIFSVLAGATTISLRLLGLFPTNGSPLLLPLLLLERATTVTMGVSCLILFSSMIADVVEDSQLRTGRRSEGLFYAAMSLVNKAVSGLGTFVGAQMLGLVNFPQHADPATLDPSIIRHLAYLYLPVMLVLYGTAMVVISQYRISRETHEDNLRRLAESEAMSPDAPAVESAAAEKQVDYIAARGVTGV
jgi:Na+/melibiose symporter-like transporter